MSNLPDIDLSDVGFYRIRDPESCNDYDFFTRAHQPPPYPYLTIMSGYQGIWIVWFCDANHNAKRLSIGKHLSRAVLLDALTKVQYPPAVALRRRSRIDKFLK